MPGVSSMIMRASRNLHDGGADLRPGNVVSFFRLADESAVDPRQRAGCAAVELFCRHFQREHQMIALGVRRHRSCGDGAHFRRRLSRSRATRKDDQLVALQAARRGVQRTPWRRDSGNAALLHALLQSGEP